MASGLVHDELLPLCSGPQQHAALSSQFHRHCCGHLCRNQTLFHTEMLSEVDRFKKFDQSFLQWLIGVSEGVIADDCEGFGSTTRRKVNGQGNMNK